MRSIAFVVAAVALAGCLPAIPAAPASAGARSLAGAAPPVLAPCLLLHEQRERPRWMGVEGWPGGTWPQVIGTVLVRHPAGAVVIDPGMGRHVVDDLRRAPPWFQLVMGDGRNVTTVPEALRRAGVSPAEVRVAVITHAHWDHVGGLRDLPRTRLLLSDVERAWALERRGRIDHGTMPFQLAPVRERLEAFELDGPPYEGFEASHDVLGDGSLVAVPLPGHTPGSTGYFLNSGDGRRWFFVGDAAWTADGVQRPAHKAAPASAFVDSDVVATGRTLARLHAFHRAHPEVELVVAHDRGTMKELPACGAGR